MIKMSETKEEKQKHNKEEVKQKSKEVLSYYLKEPYVPFVIFIFLSILMNAFIPLEGFFRDSSNYMLGSHL